MSGYCLWLNCIFRYRKSILFIYLLCFTFLEWNLGPYACQASDRPLNHGPMPWRSELWSPRHRNLPTRTLTDVSYIIIHGRHFYKGVFNLFSPERKVRLGKPFLHMLSMKLSTPCASEGLENHTRSMNSPYHYHSDASERFWISFCNHSPSLTPAKHHSLYLYGFIISRML